MYFIEIYSYKFYLFFFFSFNYTPTTKIYTRPYTLSLHDALPISRSPSSAATQSSTSTSRRYWRSTARSEEHTSEFQSHGLISYAVFCLNKKKKKKKKMNFHKIIKKKKIQ